MKKSTTVKKFNVKYMEGVTPYLEKFKGNCWDVRATAIKINGVDVSIEAFKEHGLNYKAGDTIFCKFGFAIDMTDQKGVKYVGYLYSRSSTFKNYGWLLTNGIGMIDNEYKGNSDQWCGMFTALKDGHVAYNDRVAQIEFREEAPQVELVVVENLENQSRGGYGSTGK